MADRVLVAYATKYGATAEIARYIGEVLRKEGLDADVMSVGSVGDLGPYRAVVIGSAAYIGRWRKEAFLFLLAHERALTEKMVWLFTSGPMGEGDPVKLTEGWRMPARLQPIADRISPRGVALFHGAADPGKLNFLERWILKNVKVPAGDFRDWNAIAAWACEIAAAVKRSETRSE